LWNFIEISINLIEPGIETPDELYNSDFESNTTFLKYRASKFWKVREYSRMSIIAMMDLKIIGQRVNIYRDCNPDELYNSDFESDTTFLKY